LPQLWAMAVHRHPQVVDGIYYISRHLNDRPAVAVFNRAAAKLGAAAYTPLSKARGALAAIAELHISFDYP
ncbi:MAG TPA: RES domain-containing protein, partial [Gammaproteobacteria bacterium]|nr:RES domain-containing protein [Gammaproteobacteria bacterium]